MRNRDIDAINQMIHILVTLFGNGLSWKQTDKWIRPVNLIHPGKNNFEKQL